MSTNRTIKEAVEKLISMLPADLQDKELARQIYELERVRNQIDGISWLLVVDGRWNSPIGEWVKAQLEELDARLHQLMNAKVDALLQTVEADLQGCRHEAA